MVKSTASDRPEWMSLEQCDEVSTILLAILADFLRVPRNATIYRDQKVRVERWSSQRNLPSLTSIHNIYEVVNLTSKVKIVRKREHNCRYSIRKWVIARLERGLSIHSNGLPKNANTKRLNQTQAKTIATEILIQSKAKDAVKILRREDFTRSHKRFSPVSTDSDPELNSNKTSPSNDKLSEDHTTPPVKPPSNVTTTPSKVTIHSSHSEHRKQIRAFGGNSKEKPSKIPSAKQDQNKNSSEKPDPRTHPRTIQVLPRGATEEEFRGGKTERRTSERTKETSKKRIGKLPQGFTRNDFFLERN